MARVIRQKSGIDTLYTIQSPPGHPPSAPLTYTPHPHLALRTKFLSWDTPGAHVGAAKGAPGLGGGGGGGGGIVCFRY